MIVYETRTWSDEINRLEIIRQTDKCIFYYSTGALGKKEKRQEKGKHIHDSWVAARAYLIMRMESRLVTAQRDAELAELRLARIRATIPEIEPEPLVLPESGKLRL